MRKSNGDVTQATAALFADGSVLADLGVCGSPGHDANLARDPRHRGVVRGSAISRVELHRTRARRRHRCHVVDDLPGAFPARLEAQADLALGVAQGA